MEKRSLISKFINWLKNTEMFERPAKKIPGKWQLIEYYSEPGSELVHVTQNQLNDKNQLWEIEFMENQKFVHRWNIPNKCVSEIEDGTWSISRNYVTIIHPADFRKNAEFQFAFEGELLKLLKKNTFGKIDFFGFFKRLN